MTEDNATGSREADKIDYMDVKAASEIMEEVRTRTRVMLRTYRDWRGRYETSLMKSSHLLMTDDLMREQIRGMYSLYRVTNGEFHRLYRKSLSFHAANDRYGWQRKGDVR